MSVAYSLSRDYSDFYTDEPVGFADFDKINARCETLGIGVVFLGYQWLYLSFVGMGSDAQMVPVGGWNTGAHLELGGDVIAGPLQADGLGPPSDWYAEPWPIWTPVPSGRTARELYQAFFDTGSARLSPCERRELRKFVDRAAGRWAEEPPPRREWEP